MPRSFLVTGCAGFIGSHLTEALLDAGNSVVGVDCFTDYYAREIKEANLTNVSGHKRFTCYEIDLATAPVSEYVREVDGVFHLAAQPGVRSSWGRNFTRYTRDNILSTQRVFEACAVSSTRVVFASSSSVYGNAARYPTPEDVTCAPVSPYGVTKLTCESLAQAYARSGNLDVVSLRYFTVFGPRQRPDMAFTRIVKALAEDTSFTVLGSGEQSRDFTYVDDAVRATISAFERGKANSVYNVGGGTEATLREVISLCETITGRSLRVEYEEAVAGDVTRTAADTTRIRKEVGWRPSTMLVDGLAAHIGWVGAAGFVSGKYGEHALTRSEGSAA